MNLHYEAVAGELHELLNKLMRLPELSAFYLVGGTSLALYYGHRVSVDIDLFTHEPFDSTALDSTLSSEFTLTESTITENSVTGYIEGIKADFITHRYPLIGEVQNVDGLRLLPVEDIAAMKLNAIANRGSKKDFYDIFELLQHFQREQLLEFYTRKYPRGSAWNVEKSLTYFDDAEAEPDPVDLSGRSWDQIKAGVLGACRM